MTIEQRFWAKVQKSAGCWLWTASKRHKGYGAFTYTKDGHIIQDRAHRYSWTLHRGKIPTGLCVLHRCDVPACVNPAHLFLGTKAVNNADTLAKGRYVRSRRAIADGARYQRGEAHHASKLTASIVRNIRAKRAAGYSFGVLSKEFGVAIGHIFRIVTRKAWAHVD